MPRAERTSSRLSGNATRSRILAAAAALFAEHGYPATSVRMVARSLGLTESGGPLPLPVEAGTVPGCADPAGLWAAPLDRAAPSRETVIDQVLHLVNWWIAHPKLGQMILRGQLANEEPALQYLAASEASWDRLVTEPLMQIAGESLFRSLEPHL